MPKDSIEHAAGAGATIKLKGKDYTIKPMTIGDWVEFRSYIRSKRIEDFAKASFVMDPVDKVQGMVMLASQTITETDIENEAITPEGMIFMLWRTFMKTDPELTMEDVSDLMQGEDVQSLAAISNGLSGGDEGNPPLAEAAIV